MIASYITFLQGLTDTATSICQTMTNVSGSVTQKLKTLFLSTTSGVVKHPVPSTTSGVVVKHPVSAFDPTRESAVAVNKKRKRKAVRIKPVTLTVMAITKYTYSIPKGKHYSKALREGRKQQVQITRVMTSQEVKQAILSSFKHLRVDNYEMLQVERSGRLSSAEEQSPDGASLVEGICKRKAMLYIRPKYSEVYFRSYNYYVCIAKGAYSSPSFYFAQLNNFLIEICDKQAGLPLSSGLAKCV